MLRLGHSWRAAAPPAPPSPREGGVVLRVIAHDERKSITDLINEGLDHVLAKRNYPGTADLRRKK